MTGRDGRKTPRFYRFVWLVISCPSLLVLKYKEISHFVFWSVCISATITIGCSGHELLSLDRFLLSCSICYVRFHCRAVGVCRLLLGECTEPYQQLVWLVFMVIHYCFAFVCNFGLLPFYSKFVTTFPTGSAGRNSTYRFNPLSAVISYFTCRLLRLVQLVSQFLLVLPLFNPLNGGKTMYFPKLCDLSDWLFWLQCAALISFVFCFEGFLSSVVSDHYD